MKSYCRNRLDYKVTCLTARPSISGVSQGVVRLIRREKPVRWVIDSTRYHGPNVISCKLVTGLTRTPLVSAYIPLSTLDHLPYLEKALKYFKDCIVLEELNVNLNKVRSRGASN